MEIISKTITGIDSRIEITDFDIETDNDGAVAFLTLTIDYPADEGTLLYLGQEIMSAVRSECGLGCVAVLSQKKAA